MPSTFSNQNEVKHQVDKKACETQGLKNKTARPPRGVQNECYGYPTSIYGQRQPFLSLAHLILDLILVKRPRSDYSISFLMYWPLDLVSYNYFSSDILSD